MPPIKLCMAVPNEPWYAGGIERVATEISKRLNPKKYDVTFLSGGKKSGVFSWNGLKVHIHKGYTRAYSFSPGLLRELQKEHFDVIHAHSFTSFIPLATSIAKRFHKETKVILHPHYHHKGSNVVYDRLRFVYDPLMSRFLSHASDFLVAVSHVELDFMCKRLRLNLPYAVIGGGVDLARIRNAKPYAFSGKLVLCVGRLERYKNVHFVVAAMKYLPKEYKLGIIGEGPFKNELVKLAHSLGLKDRILFLGYQPSEAVYRWMKTCGVFVHLSSIEAFGLICIEALAAGKPLIVNDDHFGLRETVSRFPDAAKLISVNEISPKKLAELIEETYGKKIKADISRFSWENVAMRFSKIYDKVLEPQKG